MRDYYLWCNTIFWQKIQNCYFLLNSMQNLIRNCRTRWWFSFFFLLFENGNTVFLQIYYLLQKIKIVSLGWNLALRLIRIYIIQWWCSFFLFLTRSIIFSGNLNLFKISKLFFETEMQNLDLFEYVKFDDHFHFFLFLSDIPFLG